MGRRAGTLRDELAGLAFDYDPAWAAADRASLSQSLPVDGDVSAEAARAFFGGLLPEGAPRELLARRFGISAANDFALLELIGGDCAGAVTLLPAGARPQQREGSAVWLDADEVARLVAELPQRPMHADERGEFRLSLAGAQDKLPVVVDAGRIGLPAGGRPSTHILKASIRRLPATVLNEAFCLAFGSGLAISTVSARPHRAGDQVLLLVDRYDRTSVEGETLRLHQEDFCQALGTPSDRKYQREGGPGLADCFTLVDRATTTPAAAKAGLLDAWALSFLVGNHGAHGKNLSLLYRHRATTLAPVYDVLSTVIYWKVEEMDRKMAMHVGGEYRPAYVRERHLERMAQETGMSPRLVRRRLVALARRAPDVAERTRARFQAELWWDPFLDAIVDTIARRAEWLEGAAGYRSAAGQTSR